MLDDPNQKKWQALLSRVLMGPGKLPADIRQQAADNRMAHDVAAAWVGQIHADALRTTDAQLDALRPTHSEDQLFELTVAAATGAGRARLDKVLVLLAEAEAS
jgi:alkylhydroperoxidase family enzyme